MVLNTGQTKILEAAKRLFFEKGLKKVSIEEICRAAVVSKMTFYRNYSNKSDIAFKVIENELIISQRIYDEIMNSEKPFLEKIHEIIIEKKESSKRISKEFLQDIFNSDVESINLLIENHTQTSLVKLKSFFNEAKLKNHIRSDINVDLLILMINSFAQKMKDPSFLSIFDSVEEASKELNNFFFYGIMPEPAI
jgi:AcrR family transcriptional regulator